jgi:hypothetical protein
MSDNREVEFHITKSELSGRPVVRVLAPHGTQFDDLIRIQKDFFVNVLPEIGLRACEGCYSGIDRFIFEERFEQVIRRSF